MPIFFLKQENVRSSVTPATMAHFAAIVRRSQKLALEAYQRRKANGEDATESAETFDDYIMRAANEAANRSQTVNNASQRSTTVHSAITASQRYSRLLRSQTSEQSEVASETAKPKVRLGQWCLGSTGLGPDPAISASRFCEDVVMCRLRRALRSNRL